MQTVCKLGTGLKLSNCGTLEIDPETLPCVCNPVEQLNAVLELHSEGDLAATAVITKLCAVIASAHGTTTIT